jgi:hypothetical protein
MLDLKTENAVARRVDCQPGHWYGLRNAARHSAANAVSAGR